MEMESSRRPLDRSREPGLSLKKPRLSDESDRNQGLNRPFAAVQRPAANNPLASRLRAAERESDGGDSGRRGGGGGGGYQPQPLPSAQHQELVSQYRAALAELTFNSKPIITNLTIIAGENLHASKAIVSTICANIIEVPSDQKLPSLYLLDSIVKNIGRDYIKHFAAKLPEVFCKAYRQVDPPIHQSMRHLFGTWKGVFPPQTLQMIEKELAFASAINGSSAGPTTSRPDSQANRPSIHVNPKYLERRLQQPNRAKGLSNEVSGTIVNSLEDAESMDRATSISTGRSWVDPAAKMHRSQRGSEGIREKNVSADYTDYDYGSDFRRNSGLGIDRAGARIVEQGHEKPWYPDGSNLPESLSGQRNSYNIKHGFPNYSAPKPANLQSVKNIVSRSSGGMSVDSWKNSDEEEFRWGDVNSRLTEHGASDISSNFRKDRSASVDSDRSGIEDHIHRSQSTHDYASRIHKEVSAEPKDFSALGHRISSAWLSPDSQSVDGPMHPGPSSFGYTGNGALGTGGAPSQQRFQSLKSGPSSLRQHSPSPSLTTHHPNVQLPGLAEQDRSRTQSLGHSDPKVSQFSGKFNTGMHDPYSHDTATILPSHGQPGKVVKSQVNEALVSSSIPDIHQRHQYALPHQVEDPSEPLNQIQKLLPLHISSSGTPSSLGSYAPDRSNGHPVNTIEDSSPSSLLAAVMKSGILSNSSITTSSLPGLNLQNMGQLPSQKGQSPVPSGPTSMMSANPRSKVSPSSSVGHSSHDSQSASVKISQKKVEHSPLPSGPPSSSSPSNSASENTSKDIKGAPDPISNLLSSLVAKGLISASKTESPTPTPTKAVTSNETQKKSPSVAITSPVPPSLVSASTVSPTRDKGASVSEPSPANPVSPPEATKSEIKNLIGFDFKPDVIRVFQPTVVSYLLDGYEHSCTICGLRMKLQERLNRHLEWHDMKKTESDGPIKASRKWYAKSSDWISAGSGHTSIDSVDEHDETTCKDEPMVPADESNCVCILCGEIFKDFYCQESDEWMFKGAKHMMIPCGGGGEIGSVNDGRLCKGPIVHAKCITESSLQDLGLASRMKTETDV